MSLWLIISILLFNSSREFSLYLNFHYTNSKNDATLLLLEDNLSEPVACEILNYFQNDKNRVYYLLEKYPNLSCSVKYFNNKNCFNKNKKLFSNDRYNIYQLIYVEFFITNYFLNKNITQLEFSEIDSIILKKDNLRDIFYCLSDFPNNLWIGDSLCLKNFFFYLPLFHSLRYFFLFR